MLVKTNVQDLLDDLKELEKDMTRRLEQMVRGFMYKFTVIAVGNTPLGDDVLYEKLYQRRLRETGLRAQDGYAQGNWSITQSPTDLYSGDAATQAAMSALSSYKLGQTVNLSNSTSYLNDIKVRGSGQLVNIQAEVIQPTINTVLQTYQITLQAYYNEN